MGDKSHLHKFAMVVIVENVCAAFRATQPDEARTMSFCDMCEAIAIHLYMKSFNVLDV